MKTNYVQKDVLSFIRYIIEPFQNLAKAKNIYFQLQTNVAQLVMDVDIKKLQIILINLLSNAVKFTPENGKIIVEAMNLEGNLELPSKLFLSITNSESTISPKDLPHIFNRFYRGNHKIYTEGTGIGLAFTKGLVKLMNEKIKVKSDAVKGTTFQIFLPKTNVAPIIENQSSNTDFSETFAALIEEKELPKKNGNNLGLPQLLIVEDNTDVQIYLQSILINQYQLQFAKNGKEGIEWAFQNVPDLILSDVMMPEMDGYELCQTLKNDIRTSHIPIILLTAKASFDSKLEGLSVGADAYLTKPFEQVELLMRLKKLCELRLNLHKRYAASPPTVPSSHSAVFEKKDQFIEQLRHFILENLDNPSLEVPEICRAIGMSRTQLHRKMIALTGSSITKFIRKIRLEAAAQLLKITTLPITQIALDLGIDPKQFARIFKQKK